MNLSILFVYESFPHMKRRNIFVVVVDMNMNIVHITSYEYMM